jgi:hypothetical protein
VQVVACVLVFDYIRMFVESFSEGDVELLLVLLQCMYGPMGSGPGIGRGWSAAAIMPPL